MLLKGDTFFGSMIEQRKKSSLTIFQSGEGDNAILSEILVAWLKISFWPEEKDLI